MSSSFNAFMESHISTITDFDNYLNMGGKFAEYIREHADRLWKQIFKNLKNTRQIPSDRRIIEWINDGSIEIDYTDTKGLQASSITNCPEDFQILMLDVLEENQELYKKIFERACENYYCKLRDEMLKRKLLASYSQMIYLALKSRNDDFVRYALMHNEPSPTDIMLAFDLEYEMAMRLFIRRGYEIDIIHYLNNDEPGKTWNYLKIFKELDRKVDLYEKRDFGHGMMILADYAFLEAKWNIIRGLQQYGFDTTIVGTYEYLEDMILRDRDEWKINRFLAHMIYRVVDAETLARYWNMPIFRDILVDHKLSEFVWVRVIYSCFRDNGSGEIVKFLPLAHAISYFFCLGSIGINYENYSRNYKKIYASRFLNQSQEFQIAVVHIFDDQNFRRQMLDNAIEKGYLFLAQKLMT